MKKRFITFLIALSTILVAMTFQSCPSHMAPVPETDMYAYVYNPEDSIYVRLYTLEDNQLQKHEMNLRPYMTVLPLQWYSGFIPSNNESGGKPMKKTVLRSYARLIARVGVNVRKGQEVIIQCDLDQPKFVELVVDECYKAGAKKVTVEFSYQPLAKLHYRHRSVTSLAKIEEWEKARLQHYVETLPCRIYLVSEDPDGLKGINQEKMAKANQKRYPIIKPYRDQMENKYQWCIAAVPGAAWAKKMFPDLSKSKAIEKLWEAILFTARVTDDPVAAWEAHNKDLRDRCAYLNSLGIDKLIYKGTNGTDFTVGMIPEAEF